MAVLSTAFMTNREQEISELHWKKIRLSRMDPNQIPYLFGYQEPSVDVFSITKRMGVGLFYLPNAPKFQSIDGLLQIQNGTPQIFINKAHHRVRQRFTVAHELGHLLLHPLEDGKVLFRSSDLSNTTLKQEREANDFAAKLLMPEKMVRNYVHLASISNLANAFDVSEKAMEIRVSNILEHRGRRLGR